MFSASYKYALHAEKPIIKLTPTAGTWMKAFAPTILIFGFLAVASTVASRQQERVLTELDEDIKTHFPE